VDLTVTEEDLGGKEFQSRLKHPLAGGCIDLTAEDSDSEVRKKSEGTGSDHLDAVENIIIISDSD